LREAETLAQSLAIELVPRIVETAAEIESTIEAFARVPDGGLVLAPDATLVTHGDLIINLAARHRLPAVYPYRHFTVAGGLMSYGIDYVEPCRQAATYVNRILRGDKPANLPVQAPTKYETMINLKTAKALGLTVPTIMQMTADEVIE
jgi:putative ABC transport system substrate-binding protein